MLIRNVGTGLASVVNIMGSAIDEVFTLQRPMVEFSLENVCVYVVFLMVIDSKYSSVHLLYISSKLMMKVFLVISCCFTCAK